jgi:hypothetical protein
MRTYRIFNMMGTKMNAGKLICGYCGCVVGVKQESYVDMHDRPGLVQQFNNWAYHPECGHKVYYTNSMN